MNKNTLLLLAALFLVLGKVVAQQGLEGEYYAGLHFERKIFTRIDHDIDFDWPLNVPPGPDVPATQFSARWTGRILAPETGHYYFAAKVDDGLRLWIGNTLVIDAWDLHDSESFDGGIDLLAGHTYDLKVEYFNGMLEGEMHLTWELPSQAPVFKGWLGHNDRKIDPKYFLQPVKNTGMLAGTKPAIPQVDPVRKKPAPRAEKTPVKPEPAKKTADLADTIQRFTPRNILFEQSKSVMLQGSLAELDNLADMLQRHPVLKVSVEGHTDNIGDLVKNQKLSEERAAAVAVYLVHKGIAPERVSSRGYGSSRSLTSDPSPEGHMKNRRVEFVIR